MAWDRRKLPTVISPPSPRWRYWLAAGAVALLVAMTLFFLSASDYFPLVSSLNIWFLSLSLPSLWAIAICVRCWLWARETEYHEFLHGQAGQAQVEWQNWSERYLAVLASWVMLPEGSAALAVSRHPDPNIVVQYRRVCKFDGNTDKRQYLYQLADNILYKINELPCELPVLITLVTDSASDEPALLGALTCCVNEFISHRTDPPNIRIRYQLSLTGIAERLAQPELTVELIILMQLNPSSRYSDGLAALLLTSDDVATKYQLGFQAKILRPMPVNTDAFADELEQFLTTQVVAVKAADVFCDSRSWTDEIPVLLSQGQKRGSAWYVNDIRCVERWSGIPGPYSPWIMAAIAADRVQVQQGATLVLSRTEQESFIYTVTAGSENEKSG